MGNSQSSSTDSTRHVFSPTTPVNFSPSLISSLESTPETNSSRSKTVDLHIQQRVAEELKKIQDEASSKLDAARKKISEEAEKLGSEGKRGTSEVSGKGEKGGSLLDMSNVSAKDLLPSSLKSSESEAETRKKQSSSKVQSQLDQLKAQLSQRKVLKELPKDVEKARGDVVNCLRVNDRRPLDCWKEVEVFKAAVRRLEEDFVSKVL
jgi:MICOS complex subunit MIC19